MGRKKKNKRYRHQGGVLTEIKEKEARVPEVRTKEAVATNFKLIIPKDIHQKIMWWIHKANFEVSGFGSLDYDEKENTFTVRDVVLLKQKVGPASAEICPNAMNKAMFQQRDQLNALKWHWHSHVRMPVFWSSDDMEIIRSLGQQSWVVATVFNQMAEMKTAFLTQVQVFGKAHDIFVDDISTKVQEYLPRELADSLDAQYDEMVEQPQPYRGGGGPMLPGQWEGLHLDGPIEKPVHSLSEELWAPQAPHPTMYDEFGYAVWGNDLVYNPIYDESLTTRAQQINMVGEMDDQEVHQARSLCPEFAKLVQEYIVAQASRVDKVDKSEAEELNGNLLEEYQPLLLGE